MQSRFREGVVETIPLAIPGAPFGLILGLAIAEAPIDGVVGWVGAWFILAGASQLTMITLMTEGAATAAALAAGLVINLRHVMYSLALASKFQSQPRWFRWLGPYGLLDQVFAMADLRRELAPDEFRAYYLGSLAMMLTPWTVSVAVGVVFGAQVPEAWNLAVAVPVLFAGLMVLGIKNRAGVIAATAAFVVAVSLSHLPNRIGLLIGAVVGVALAAAVPLQGEPVR